jgi:hypothetical protein
MSDQVHAGRFPLVREILAEEAGQRNNPNCGIRSCVIHAIAARSGCIAFHVRFSPFIVELQKCRLVAVSLLSIILTPRTFQEENMTTSVGDQHLDCPPIFGYI